MDRLRPSNVFAELRRRPRAVGVGAGVLAVILAVVFVLVGFWRAGDDNARRDAVSAYVREVNLAQSSLEAALGRVNRSYRALGNPKADPVIVASDIDRSRSTMALVRRRVAAASAPEDAAVLRREIIRLFRLQEQFAGEISLLARFVPAISAERIRIAEHTRALRDALRDATPAAQSAALSRYAKDVEAAAAPLTVLRAPEALRPVLVAERERLRTLRLAALGLRTAMLEGDEAATRALVDRLATTVAGGSNAVERRSAIAYNDAVRRINGQRSRVEQELRRLDATVR